MSAQLKAAKDALVSSLYELSKAANDASAATVNFYNASLNTDEDATKIFADLADSLKLLTRASEGVSASAHTIAGDAILPMFSDITGDVGVPDVVLPSQPAASKPKRAQAEKDPYAPKKPLTMFFAYSSYIRESIRAERAAKGEPPLSSTEVTKAISDRWGSLSDEEKEKWKEAYTKELATYQELKEKYIEDKKNGVAQQTTPTTAPIPLPSHLKSSKKRPSESSEEKKKKKKEKKEKKEKRKSLAEAAAAGSLDA